MAGINQVGYRTQEVIDGLVHLRNRDYDPTVGVFTSTDPLDGISGTVTETNPYHYADNDPVNKTDALGLSPDDCNLFPDSPLQGLFQALCDHADQGLALAVGAAAGTACAVVAAPSSPVGAGVAAGVCAGAAARAVSVAINGGTRDQILDAAMNPKWVAVDAALGAALAWVAPKIASAVDRVLFGGAAEESTASTIIHATEPGSPGTVHPEPTQIHPPDGTTPAIDETPPVDLPQCASFAADTPVLMADGTTKPIRDVEVGDQVKATDPSTGKTEARAVTAVKVHDDNDLMDVTVNTAGGDSVVIHTNAHHIFWDASERSWLRVDELHAGDRLTTADGAIATVGSVASVAGHERMWDLTVEGIHTFYVDFGHGAVVVHNDPTGIVYLRTDRATGQEYVRQAKDYARYLARQKEHGVGYDFEILQEGIEPGTPLDVAEENWIRAGGGRIREGGRLANDANSISDERYNNSGGEFPGDRGCP